MNLKRYNGEFYIMEYEETEEKNLKLFVDVLNKSYQEIINFFNLKKSHTIFREVDSSLHCGGVIISL